MIIIYGERIFLENSLLQFFMLLKSVVPKHPHNLRGSASMISCTFVRLPFSVPHSFFFLSYFFTSSKKDLITHNYVHIDTSKCGYCTRVSKQSHRWDKGRLKFKKTIFKNVRNVIIPVLLLYSAGASLALVPSTRNHFINSAGSRRHQRLPWHLSPGSIFLNLWNRS